MIVVIIGVPSRMSPQRIRLFPLSLYVMFSKKTGGGLEKREMYKDQSLNGCLQLISISDEDNISIRGQ